MKRIGHTLVFFISSVLFCQAQVLEPVLKDVGHTSSGNNAYMESNVDYTRLLGRVTDYDKDKHLLKIQTENNNIKFFKVGDLIQFFVNRQQKYKLPCKANVRNIEEFYMVVYVRDLSLCWDDDKFFRRGSMVNIRSEDLKNRVITASDYRKQLIKKKQSYLGQLNGLNNDIWTYKEQKLKMAAQYDLKINELKKQKQRALDNLIEQKKSNIDRRNQLITKLDHVDEKLDFYRVERQEPLLNRWAKDHDTGFPMARRPKAPFEKKKSPLSGL